MKLNRFYSLLFSVALVTSCGSDGPFGGSVVTNPATQFGNQVKNYMNSAAPSVGSSFVGTAALTAEVASDWSTTQTEVKRPGNGSATAGTPARYVSDVLNESYSAGDFSPTVFGRFQGEIDVLKILGAQVPFNNGVPALGSHSVTTTFGDDTTPTTVTANVTAASDTTNFDVIIDLPTIKWKAAFRNNATHANMVAVEYSSTTNRGVSKLFWNKSTGKLRYDYVARQDSGAKIEIQRLFIEQTNGQSYLAHIYEDNSTTYYVGMSADKGSTSTEFTVDFQTTDRDTGGGDNSFARQEFCVSASTGLATSNAACASGTLPSGNLTDLRAQLNGYTTPNSGQAMTTAVLGGTNDSDLINETMNYDTGSLGNFFTSLL